MYVIALGSHCKLENANGRVMVYRRSKCMTVPDEQFLADPTMLCLSTGLIM